MGRMFDGLWRALLIALIALMAVAFFAGFVVGKVTHG